MMIKTNSLKSQFFLIITVPLIILILLQSAIFITFLLWNQSRTEYYVNGILKNVTSSINDQAYTIEKMSYTVTTDASLASLYYNHTADPNQYAQAFQSASRICQFNSDVLDVVIVDTSGKPTSLYAGYGEDYKIISQLKETYNFSDKKNTDRFFYFFPTKRYPGADYFVYLAPVQISNEKVATAVFVCSLYAIKSALNYQIGDVAYTFNIYDQSNNLIYSNDITKQTNDDVKQIASTVPNTGLTIRAVIPTAFSGKNAEFMVFFYLFSSIIIVFMLIGILLIIRKRIMTPLRRLMLEMDSIGQSSLKQRLKFTKISEINIFVENINTMLEKIDNMTRKIFDTQNELYESEIRKSTAELYALQSQINPHFFCNTMQCIRGIALIKDDAEIASIALAMNDLFRYTIKSDELVEVQDEISIIEEYLSIYDIRFSGRFTYDIDIEPIILHCTILKLLLQPIVENAMQHGISKVESNGKIKIIGRKVQDDLVFHVIDNGPGINKETLEKIKNSIDLNLYDKITTHSNEHLGLSNINRRVKIKYGCDYGIYIDSDKGLTDITLKVPFIKE